MQEYIHIIDKIYSCKENSFMDKYSESGQQLERWADVEDEFFQKGKTARRAQKRKANKVKDEPRDQASETTQDLSRQVRVFREAKDKDKARLAIFPVWQRVSRWQKNIPNGDAKNRYIQWVVDSLMDGYPRVDRKKDIVTRSEIAKGAKAGGQGHQHRQSGRFTQHEITGMYAHGGDRSAVSNEEQSFEHVMDQLVLHISQWKILVPMKRERGELMVTIASTIKDLDDILTSPKTSK